MKKFGKRKNIIISMLLLVIVLFGIGLAVFGEPFFVARIRCGGDPIYHSTGFKEGREYVTPSNPSYRFSLKTRLRNITVRKNKPKLPDTIKI